MKDNKMKKGSLFFTIDTLIAGFILIVLILLVLSFASSSPVNEDTKAALDEYYNYILSTPMRSISINVYTKGTQRPDIRDLRVHEKVSLLMHTERESVATSFVTNITNRILRQGHGVTYQLDNTTIYQSFSEGEKRVELLQKFITYFLYEDQIIGPNITTIKVWS
ncbi:MAG: hypothetical protein ACMXX6_00230 [Candidatus Woesearchaeota archaeon]